MPFDLQQLDHIALLSRLGLSADEREQFAIDLAETMNLVGALGAINVEGIEPLAHPMGVSVSLRDDQVTEVDHSADMLALAPKAQDGFFTVPLVLE